MINDFDWNLPLTAAMLSCPDLDTLQDVYSRWSIPKEQWPEYTRRVLLKRLEDLQEDWNSLLNTYQQASLVFKDKLAVISSLLGGV